MRRLLPFITLGLGVLAVRAMAGAKRRPYRVITLPEIQIVGRVPTDSGQAPTASTPGVGGNRRPLSVRFDVRVSNLEKFAVGPGVVAQTVTANAQSGILPGTGAPRVRVVNIASGYVVTISYPDSHGDITAIAAQRAIEGVDPRLTGRIANVMVDRA